MQAKRKRHLGPRENGPIEEEEEELRKQQSPIQEIENGDLVMTGSLFQKRPVSSYEEPRLSEHHSLNYGLDYGFRTTPFDSNFRTSLSKTYKNVDLRESFEHLVMEDLSAGAIDQLNSSAIKPGLFTQNTRRLGLQMMTAI